MTSPPSKTTLPRAKTARLWPATVFLSALYGLAAGAGFIAPYDYAEQNRELIFAPPTRLHFVDPEGGFHPRPFVYRWTVVPGTFDQYQQDRSRAFPLRLLVADSGDPPLAPLRGDGNRLFGVDKPARIHLLGTDAFGRDLFSRLLHGARISLFAGLFAGLLSAALSLILGSVAGYYGGWIDELVMRAAELFMSLPWLYLLIAVRAFLPLHITPAQTMLMLVTVVGLLGWPRTARLVRGVALAVKQRDYVLAARGFGASEPAILRRHVLPQAFAVTLTQLALDIPRYILAEVTLSFLGLGVSEPTPSWGNLLASLQHYHVLVSYGWMLLPAPALVAVILGYQRLADALQARLGTTVF